MIRTRLLAIALGVGCGIALAAPATIHAQSCTGTGNSAQRTCTVTLSATITAPRLATVTGLTAGTTIPLTDPTSGASMPYDASDPQTGTTGFAAETGIPVTVKSNARWSLFFGHQSTRNDGLGTYLWSATDNASLATPSCPGQGVCAWLAKPTGHLWVSNTVDAGGGGYTRLNYGPATSTGASAPYFNNVYTFASDLAPTAGTNFTVALKTTWRYPLDTPGSYSLPLQLILFVY